MNPNLFIMLNILLVGAIGLIILLYIIFLTRKRFAEGFLHYGQKQGKRSWLKQLVSKAVLGGK